MTLSQGNIGCSAVSRSDGGDVLDYVALMKPRVMSLVVFTALSGMYMAPGSLHPFMAFSAILCIAMAAGASGAINMWYDSDIDSVMSRTADRPVPAGRLESGTALAFGNSLAVASVLIMWFCANWQAAAFLAFTIFFYVFVYTVWLKRRTPQNIVIGGAAGAFPPMVGWVAVTGEITVGSLVLFAIIFMWTPPHFWSLSLYCHGEYEKAGVPMLPVVSGEEETRRQILWYTLVLAPIGVAPTLIGMASWFYGSISAFMGIVFLILVLRLRRDKLENSARRIFNFSLLYLFVLFAVMILDRAMGFSS